MAGSQGQAGSPGRASGLNPNPQWPFWVGETPSGGNTTAGATTFNDSPSGALVFSGSIVEAKTGANSPSGTLIFGGSPSDAKTGADSQSGTITLGGSITEAKTGADTRSGTLVLGGSVTEAKAGADSPSGALVLSGSRVESKTDADSPSGTIVFSGSPAERRTGADAPSGTILFSGSSGQFVPAPRVFTDLAGLVAPQQSPIGLTAPNSVPPVPVFTLWPSANLFPSQSLIPGGYHPSTDGGEVDPVTVGPAALTGVTARSEKGDE